MQGNIIGQSGMSVNNSLFPIYQQLNQPSDYYGIWIKSDENIKNIYFQTDASREMEVINELPYIFRNGRAISINTDIYLFGGAESSNLAQNAYKYNSIEKTYTKLANIPSAHYFDEGAIVLIDEDIYLVGIRSIGSGYEIHKYSPINNTYTNIMSMYNFERGTATVINNDIYCFGSYEENNRQTAIKYNISSKESTSLSNIPENFYYGSAVAISKNEIILFGVDDANSRSNSYKYNVTEDEYYLNKPILGDVPAICKINKVVYLIENPSLYVSGRRELGKYYIKYNSIYQYGENFVLADSADWLGQLVNINNDLYALSDKKLYKFNTIFSYDGDGIYISMQDLSIYKNIDINNVLEVKKIINQEEQTVIVYVGDGNSWKLLNANNSAQNTNTLQYTLSFEEEN